MFTFFLFPLHRGGGLGGDVVEDAVDALDLVHDAVGGGGVEAVAAEEGTGRCFCHDAAVEE